MITLDDRSKQAIQNFFRGKANNSWISLYNSNLQVYVRRSSRQKDGKSYDCFDIANWSSNPHIEETDLILGILDYVEPITNTYIECISPTLVDFINTLNNKRGYTVDTSPLPNAILIQHENFSWDVMKRKPIITEADEAYRRAMSVI